MAASGQYHEDVFGVMISAKAALSARATLAGKKAGLLNLADLIRSGDTAGQCVRNLDMGPFSVPALAPLMLFHSIASKC